MSQTQKHEGIKWEIALLIIGALLGALLSSILPPYIFLNIKPIYESNAMINQYGANYTSIVWIYNIQPEKKYIWSSPKESWAYIDMDIRNIEHDFDLSDFAGISFYIKRSIENELIGFNLFTKNISLDREIIQYNCPVLLTTNWKEQKVLFSNLSTTSSVKKWYPGAPISPDLKKVFAFGFAKNTKDPTQNEIWIDEVYLFRNNGNRTLISNFNSLNTSINGTEGLWHFGWGYL
jgi:hypothetical protein